jgi:hypothetical protein
MRFLERVFTRTFDASERSDQAFGGGALRRTYAAAFAAVTGEKAASFMECGCYGYEDCSGGNCTECYDCGCPSGENCWVASQCPGTCCDYDCGSYFCVSYVGDES